jgi:hypothetical protein
MKTTNIHEQVFLHQQCACTELCCYKIFLFQHIYPFCIHKERHLITLVLFFLILHIVDSDNSLFSWNNNVFLLIFRIKYVKHLCNSCSENSRFIFMTHICQVNDCEPVIIILDTLWVLHLLTFKYRNLYIHFIIQFSYFFNAAIINIFLLHAIFCIYSHITILILTPTILCLGIEYAFIYVIRLP